MKEINAEWDSFKNSGAYEKLAFLRELGAIYGAAYGWSR
jgi:hypothetical protein